MKLRNIAAAVITAVTLSATPAVAASAATVSTPYPSVAKQTAKSPTAAVNAYAKVLSAANGKAACALMTKGFQTKVIKAAVKAGAPSGISCTKVMTQVGKAIKANGGVPAYTLKVTKRTKTKAVVRLTYKQDNVSGTYTTQLTNGSWLIAGSTVNT